MQSNAVCGGKTSPLVQYRSILGPTVPQMRTGQTLLTFALVHGRGDGGRSPILRLIGEIDLPHHGVWPEVKSLGVESKKQR